VTLTIPPLRRRKEDLAALAELFLRQANAELGKSLQGIELAALDELRGHDWPGNVRELEHAIKRAVLLARGPLLTVHDLALTPVEIPQPGVAAGPALERLQAAVRTALHQLLDQAPDEGLYHTLVELTGRELIAEALRLTQGNQVAASRLLGLHRTTMRKKILEEK
jgi:DNA-binding NtrC family response regulator